MTTNVTVRVNGNYQVPVTISGGSSNAQTHTVNGPTAPGQPATEQTFELYQGQTISVGPEAQAPRTDDASFSQKDYENASGPAAASSAQGGRPSREDALNPEADRRRAGDDTVGNQRHIDTPAMENEEPKPQTGNPSADEMTKGKNPGDVND